MGASGKLRPFTPKTITVMISNHNILRITNSITEYQNPLYNYNTILLKSISKCFFSLQLMNRKTLTATQNTSDFTFNMTFLSVGVNAIVISIFFILGVNGPLLL